MGLIVRSRSYSAQLMQDAAALEDSVWEPFGFLSHTAAHTAYYARILEDYADLQLCLVSEDDEKPVALVNCVPFLFTRPVEQLPPEGWDWLVETGGGGQKRSANILGALAVSVSPSHRGQGLARRMIRELKITAEARGFKSVVVPVRPSSKSEHPFVSMPEYVGWKNGKGECFDPWLRSHLNEGASVLRTCERSMVVREHVAFWETWAGQRFPESGSYAFSGGLVPVRIDLAEGNGLYEEPNVWVGYRT